MIMCTVHLSKKEEDMRQVPKCGRDTEKGAVVRRRQEGGR